MGFGWGWLAGFVVLDLRLGIGIQMARYFRHGCEPSFRIGGFLGGGCLSIWSRKARGVCRKARLGFGGLMGSR